MFLNIKVEFEYKGTEYPGVAVEDGVITKTNHSQIDGFPGFTVFSNASDSPAISVDGVASISKNTTPTAGYFVINYVAP